MADFRPETLLTGAATSPWTVRDAFAAAALQGLLAGESGEEDDEGLAPLELARTAYLIAEAMMVAREMPLEDAVEDED